MYNSVKVFIFTILITSLAIFFSYQNILYGRLLNKTSEKLNRYQVDKEELKQEWEEELKEDISSKFNINFMDFTLFKQPILSNLLKPEYNWMDLDSFRIERGFVMDLEIYRSFFREDSPFDEIFTLYNIPNINNCSDTMVELYYKTVTGDEFKATQFKELLQQKRRKKSLINQKELKQLEIKYDSEVLSTFSTDPIWNREFIHPILKDVIYSFRKEIQETWLGDRTTFYRVYLESKDKVDTELIYRWDEKDKTYHIFKLERISP